MFMVCSWSSESLAWSPLPEPGFCPTSVGAGPRRGTYGIVWGPIFQQASSFKQRSKRGHHSLKRSTLKGSKWCLLTCVQKRHKQDKTIQYTFIHVQCLQSPWWCGQAVRDHWPRAFCHSLWVQVQFGSLNHIITRYDNCYHPPPQGFGCLEA